MTLSWGEKRSVIPMPILPQHTVQLEFLLAPVWLSFISIAIASQQKALSQAKFRNKLGGLNLRNGLPLELVSDNGTQFADSGLQEWLKELHVSQIFTSVAHQQANGQKNSSNSETPFSLTYGTEAMIPAKIGVPSARTLLIEDNDKELQMNLNLLEERRELASIREHNYKCQLQKYYDSRVKKCMFDAGDFVCRNNEASGQEPPGMLAPTWEGP
ncbi:uncharacterized protein LOC143575458 [Bidens hawaiensis]|uniref:uncharacterized protein LOC143575458 n=1 Tax=Bidens hawaiensis TaxID=980011 RepID=UPI00404AA56A